MGSLDRTGRAIHSKLVYVGAPGAGKTANLELLGRKLKREHRGDLKSVQDDDGTWEHLPVSLGEVRGWQTSFEICAVPAGEHAEALRRRLLLDADGIVFVADLRPERHEATLAALEEMLANLSDQGRDLEDVALVVQYNHRDAVDESTVESLHRRLGLASAVSFDAVATEGKGVLQTLSALAKQVLARVRTRPESPEPIAEIEETPPPPLAPEITAAEATLETGAFEETTLDASIELEAAPLLDEAPAEPPRWQLQVPTDARLDGDMLILPLRLQDAVSGQEIALELQLRLSGAHGS